MGSTLMATTNSPRSNLRNTLSWRDIAKSVWWIVVLLATVYLILIRWNSITSDEPTSFDLGLFSLAVVLILLPFISEISAFGFTVKKQIEEAKKELRQDIRDEVQFLRNEISIGITNRLISNIFFQASIPYPPPDSALPNLREQIAEIVQQFLKERGIRGTPQPSAEAVPPDAIFAFQQRYLIEKEIKRLWNTRIHYGDFERYPPFGRMVDDLVRHELITPSLGASLREVFAVASSIIHGDAPSQEKIDFLRDVTPRIIATLSSIW